MRRRREAHRELVLEERIAKASWRKDRKRIVVYKVLPHTRSCGYNSCEILENEIRIGRLADDRV